MFNTVEECVGLYKQELQKFSKWLGSILQRYKDTLTRNRLNLSNARWVLDDFARDSEIYDTRRRKIQAMAEVLCLTEEEQRIFFKEAGLSVSVLDEENLSIFIPPYYYDEKGVIIGL